MGRHWMLYLTPGAFCTGLLAAYYGLWTLVAAEWVLAVSSFIYWSDPSSQSRRRFDMLIVQLSLYIHLYTALESTCHSALLLYVLGVCSYVLGRAHASHVAHAFVWLFGCTANYVLIVHLSGRCSIGLDGSQLGFQSSP
jgi:hypothetical protein